MNENKFIKNDVVEKLGGVKSAAEFFGISSQAISQWADRAPIPRERQLECLLYKPDIFGANPKQTAA